MANNLDIFTAIWNVSSESFKQRIPSPSIIEWNKVTQLISSGDYEPERNEIYDVLFNQIAMQKVWQRSLNNPLASFKTGVLSHGSDLQEIMADIIAGQTFQIGQQDQFQKWSHNVEAAYHRINREQFYPVTIEQTKIIRAFQREGGLQSLIDSIVNQMYSSNDFDEFIYTKGLFWKYYQGESVSLAPRQELLVPDPRINLLDPGPMNAFVMTVKGLIKEMSFPKRDFNPYQFMMQTQPSDYRIFLDYNITVSSEVTVLSQAFHPQYIDINIPIIAIDQFGDPESDDSEYVEFNDNCIGIVADKQWLQIYDTLRLLKQNENARNLYRNYYYHVHQLYAASPFCNVVYLMKDPDYPPEP